MENFNTSRWLVSTLIGFIFVAGYEYGIHGILSQDIYAQTPELWHTPEDMEAFTMYNLVLNMMLVAALSYIFTMNYEGKGLTEGYRFGVIFGVVFAIQGAAPLAWMPISETLALVWAMANFFKLLGLGFIFSLFYKHKA